MMLTKQDQLRQEFPFFHEHPDWIFLENAGGSQVPQSVIDRIKDYYSRYYVQIGADYYQSKVATKTVKEAHDFCLELVNGKTVGEVVLGSSTTQLMHTLSHAFDRLLNSSDDEIIVANTAHEANYGAWTKLRASVREWNAYTDNYLETLEQLLTEKTRIVALPHVNNLIGEIINVPAIVDLVHRRSSRARVIVDGVAYAPHRLIDVNQWKVDFYVFSLYKVYGPHMAVLYGSNESWKELIDAAAGPNHFFISQSDIRYQYELGCISHESCAAILGIRNYFRKVVDATEEQPIRQTIEQVYENFARWECPLTERLFGYLKSKPEITILGSTSTERRVPTISFTHSNRSSKDIVAHLNQNNIACRNGHMYAYRLVDQLQIDLDDGVVRLSAVHYNTIDEIERCIRVLESIL